MENGTLELAGRFSNLLENDGSWFPRSCIAREVEMCLAVPGRVVDVFREQELLMGKVDFGGVAKRICLEYLPDSAIGDYVLVHVGFALARVDESEARQIFEFLERIEDLNEVRDPNSEGAPNPLGNE